MLVLGSWLMAAQAADCVDPQVLEVPRQDAAALAVALDGALTVEVGAGDALRVEACGGEAKVVRRDGVLTVLARHPLDAIAVSVPAGVVAVSVHDHLGATRIAVPARVAVVASEGALDVSGASSLRVGYLRGDAVVSEVSGDLWVDRLTGSLSARSVGGDAVVTEVSGPVVVEAVGAVTVDGVRQPDRQASR